MRSGLLERVDLLATLRAGAERTLTLVCAPAGYGKTTLLGQWEASDRERATFAWVALDERDSDPVQLWADVIAGLNLASSQVGEGSRAALAGGSHAIAEAVVPLLVDELETAPPLVLVLEDWHAVRNPLCDETMTMLVERMPAHHQLVVSSRSDPAFPIARLRAHGDLAELRARELRLSPGEVATLLEDAGVELPASDVGQLAERTEGWPAGVSLALLALRDQEDPTSFVHEFSGDSRHVFDYLADDVLAGVEPRMRHFMARSSVLGRFSAPLCDWVLERSGSAAVISEIERANLFLVALDETGTEYRYHHLFATVLRRDLDATAPLASPRLHARASKWFEEHGDLEQAVEHAIAGRDSTLASALVLRVSPGLISAGRMATLNRWLDLLSWPEALAGRELAAVRALTARLSGHGRDVVERWLAVAEDGPDYGPLPNGMSSIRSIVAMVRATYLSRGIADAERSARLVLELEAAGSEWRPAGLVALGQALFLAGRPSEARAPLEEARTLPDARRRATTIMALAYLSLIELGDGDVERARDLAERALATASAIGHASTPATGNAHLAAGSVLVRQADVRAGIDHLERAAALTSTDGASYWHAHALLRLADAHHRAGDDDAADELLARARAELDDLPDAGVLGVLFREAADVMERPSRRDVVVRELSRAEIRVLVHLAEGRSITEVAHELWLSPNTVKTHRRAIYRKLGVTTRAELATLATKLGLDARVTSSGSPV